MSENNTSVSRRNIIKTAIGSSIFLGLTSSVSADNTVEVPVGKSGDEVLVSRDVDKKWWDHVLEIRESRHGLEDNFGNSRAIHSVTTTQTDETIASHNKRKFLVKIDENEVSEEESSKVEQNPRRHVGPDIPKKHDGHEVEVSTVDYKKRCTNLDEFDPVPSGVAHDSDSSELWATFCCPVTHADYDNPLMLATSHSQVNDEKVYQRDFGFGYPTDVYDSRDDWDYQLIEHVYPLTSVTNYIENQDERKSVLGYATNLEVLEDDGDTIQKTGCTTGYGEGKIIDSNDQRITLDGEGAAGDSGAPWFTEFDIPFSGTGAFLVAMETSGPAWEDYNCNGQELPGGPHSNATTAEAIVEKEDGLEIGV